LVVVCPTFLLMPMCAPFSGGSDIDADE
jgi:hypothetical protein